jgi:hypothetical protein
VVKAVDQVTMNLPIVMGATQAKKVADITLYGTWKERISFSLSLPPKYVRIEPTDIITVNVSGVAHEMRVVKTDMEANGMMKLSAVAEDISSYDFYTPPSETSSNIQPPVLVPRTLLQFIDAPPLPVARMAAIPSTCWQALMGRQLSAPSSRTWQPACRQHGMNSARWKCCSVPAALPVSANWLFSTARMLH